MSETAGALPAGGTVLIVDDNPVNLGVVVEHLEHRGFEVAVALGGEEALERARFLRPDLILLDVMMPGIDGFETCRRLKAMPETSGIPVIFMTALGDVSDKTEGFAAGGVDYVSKPFQVGDLLARVTTHMTIGVTHRRLRQELEALRREREAGIPGARFQRLFDSAEDGILLVDCGSGLVSDANPAAAAMLGRDPAALIGRPLAELPGLGAGCAARLGELGETEHLALGAWVVERCAGPIELDVAATYRRDAEGALVELTLRSRS